MRDLKGKTGLAIACWAVIASLFQMYTAGFGFFEPREQRSIHLLLLMPLAFLLFPARPGKSPEDHPSLADWGWHSSACCPTSIPTSRPTASTCASRMSTRCCRANWRWACSRPC